MNEKKNKTPIITAAYALLTVIYIILGVVAINVFLVTFIGVPFIIISIGLAANYKHGAAIIIGLAGQILVPFTLASFYMATFWGTILEIGFLVQVFNAIIGLVICMLETFVIYPLLFIYRKEEKLIKGEKTKRFQVIVNLKNRQKTPIITGLYILLTIISL